LQWQLGSDTPQSSISSFQKNFMNRELNEWMSPSDQRQSIHLWRNGILINHNQKSSKVNESYRVRLSTSHPLTYSLVSWHFFETDTRCCSGRDFRPQVTFDETPNTCCGSLCCLEGPSSQLVIWQPGDLTITELSRQKKLFRWALTISWFPKGWACSKSFRKVPILVG
jgi:hypothetical protein